MTRCLPFSSGHGVIDDSAWWRIVQLSTTLYTTTLSISYMQQNTPSSGVNSSVRVAEKEQRGPVLSPDGLGS